MLKLIAGRPKDIVDAQGIVDAQLESIDEAEVRELLEQIQWALGQSDLVPAFDGLLEKN